MHSRSSALLSSAAVAATLILGLSGCSVVGQVMDAAQGKADVFTLSVGDCTNDDAFASEELSSVATPSCDESHDNEIYLAFEFDGDKYPAGSKYPGEEAVMAEAESQCFPAFEDFVDALSDETSLYYGSYYPSAESWDDGDREVLCLVYDMNGPVTGSLEGKGAEYPL
jgi:hypothetical protein